MPSIWNVNNMNNTNNKKVSGKLTFEVGEKFSGRVVGQSEDKEVIIKLSDGWQFTAEIEGDIDPNEQTMVRFVVEGFDEGKLKLKVLQGQKSNIESIASNLENIINKEGLKQEDISLLKAMIKHNIPLTRENILNAKSIIQFNENINGNNKEITDFIDSFIASKNIDPSSDVAKNIKTLLSDFMTTFKNMPKEDIMFFLENKIEITKENIESFNKLFKEEGFFKEVINKADVVRDTNITPKDILNKKSVNSEVQAKVSLGNSNDIEENIVNKNMVASKTYDNNDTFNNKVSMLSLLKSMAGSETAISKEVLKNVLSQNVSEFNFAEYNKALSEIDKMTDSKFFKLVTNESINSDGYSKEAVNKVLTNILNKEINLNDNEFKRITEVIKTLKGDIFEEISTKLGEKKDEGSTLLTNKLDESSRELVNKDIKIKVDDIKEAIRELLNKSEGNDTDDKTKKIVDFIKSNINEFKLLNNLSNEYYYLDIPIKNNENEYPCKLIIKDDRKDGKIIDKNNVKLVVSVKTVNLGEIDGYISIADQIMNLEMKCNKNYVKLLSKGKESLAVGLASIGYLVNISVSEKKEEVNIVNCRDFFNTGSNTTIDRRV